MKYSIFIMLVFLCSILLPKGQEYNTYKKQKSVLSGTLIAIVNVKDGIIMAADSRAAITGNDSTPVAYLDSFSKIYNLHGYYIGVSGSAIYGKKLIYEIINDFNKIGNYKSDFSTTFRNFVEYINNKYPLSEYPETKKQVFLLAGVENGITCNQAYSRIDGFSEIQTKGIQINDINATPYFKELTSKYNSSYLTISEDLERIIYKYAKENNKTSTIGGPVSILWIKPDKTVIWVKNDFTLKTSVTRKELLNNLKSKKRKLFPLVKNGEATALKKLSE